MGRLAAVELLLECADVDSGSDKGKQTPLIKAGIYLQPGEGSLCSHKFRREGNSPVGP